MKLDFSTDFRKILKYHISWKSLHLELSNGHGRTDMTKPIVTLRNLPKAPKHWWTIFSICSMCRC